MNGPTIRLKDAQKLCAVGRFCHRGGGTWELTKHSDDPKSRELAIEEACQCPSGRLVACDKKTGETIEKKFDHSISLVEDPAEGVSGPLWVKGGVQIESADGFLYEKRNRCTLCRCGKSENKPFCDGSHIDAGFDDGDKSLKSKK
jgi:CDGSH-type Zn-finger protein